MEKLFIIGNGFDLAHNLKTSYCDFKENVLEDIGLIEDEAKERAIYSLDIPNLNEEERVSDYDMKKFFYLIITQLTLGDWNKFENSLENILNLDIELDEFYDKEGDFDGPQNEYYYRELNQQIISSIPKLQSQIFQEWIKKVRFSEEYNSLSSDIKIIKNNKNNLFLTFNYTDILEKVYEIPSENICHIHGSFEEDEFIFGHGGSCLENDCENSIFSLDSSLIELTNKLKKPVDRQLRKHQSFFDKLGNVSEIYIFGFNISDVQGVDAPYFKQIFSIIPNAKIFLHNHEMTQTKAVNISNILSQWGSLQANDMIVIDMKNEEIEFILGKDIK